MKFSEIAGVVTLGSASNARLDGAPVCGKRHTMPLASSPEAENAATAFRCGAFHEEQSVIAGLQAQIQAAREWERHKNAIIEGIASDRSLEDTLSALSRAFVALHPSTEVTFFLSSPQTGWNSCASAGNVPSHGGTLIEIDLSSERGLVPGKLSVAAPMNADTDREIAGVASTARLAIAHHEIHSELLRKTQFDHLTGLPNRVLLEDRLSQAIVRANRQGGHVAVCYLDLDRFKQVNDTCGHGEGDTLLCEVASRLSGSVRAVDTIARQGGDEFIVILPDLESAGEAQEICERILMDLRVPVEIGGQVVKPTASIGVSLFPNDGDTASELMRHADAALYAAKNGGRDRIQIFNVEFSRRAESALELQSSMQLALERNEFQLLYQPLYESNREISGFEALIRWNHPERGRISPDQFISVAEDNGMIVPIGEWVIGEACRQMKQWQRETGTKAKIFVNVSGVQLGRPEFPETVARALGACGLSPECLELEITESWLVTDAKTASIRLQQLRDFGIAVAIDDFGTGHSSFSCLHELAIDTIKIDKSFVARLGGSQKGSATVRTIVALAQQLGLKTVAEGVETESQFEELSGMPCGMLQGYFFARPLAADAATRLLQSGV